MSKHARRAKSGVRSCGARTRGRARGGPESFGVPGPWAGNKRRGEGATSWVLCSLRRLTSVRGGGQLCGRNPKSGAPRAVLVCTRCSWTWTWEPTVQELDYINESGMLGMTPPTKERYGDRLISEG